jgi:hypothetical protein
MYPTTIPPAPRLTASTDWGQLRRLLADAPARCRARLLYRLAVLRSGDPREGDPGPDGWCGGCPLCSWIADRDLVVMVGQWPVGACHFTHVLAASLALPTAA